MSGKTQADHGLPETKTQGRGFIFAATMMATFMAAVESTIVATAMPTIVADLGDFRLFSWVFTAYLLTQVVSVPIYGRLADLYGRKQVFFAGTSLFLFGSTLCGFSRGMLPLIAFRAIQGLGAGAVQPVAYIIVGDIYTPAERARVQGFLSGVFGFAALVGPWAGALLVEHANWAVVFWINIPIGIAAMAMLAIFLREQPAPQRRQIDYLGSALLMLGGGLLTLALVQGESMSWSTLVPCVAVGAAAMVALIWHERRTAEPILPLHLWRKRTVLLGNIGSFTVGAITMGVSGFLPMYVQGVMGRSATAAGIALGAMSVSWAAASLLAGHIMIRLSYRVSAVCGGLAAALGSVMLVALTPTSGPAWAGAGSLLVGVGMGFCNTTNLVCCQAAVARSERGAATSSNMFMRIVGQSIGAALFGAMVNIGVLRYAPHAEDIIHRLMEPTLRQGLGAAQIARVVTALAAALKNVYVVCSLFGLLALAAGAALPARMSAAMQADDVAAETATQIDGETRRSKTLR